MGICAETTSRKFTEYCAPNSRSTVHKAVGSDVEVFGFDPLEYTADRLISTHPGGTCSTFHAHTNNGTFAHLTVFTLDPVSLQHALSVNS